MQDDFKGLVNRAPFKTDQRFVTLSPTIDSWKGKQYAHNPAFAGETPTDNLDFLPGGTEGATDEEFHEFPEAGRVVGKGGKKGIRHG